MRRRDPARRRSLILDGERRTPALLITSSTHRRFHVHTTRSPESDYRLWAFLLRQGGNRVIGARDEQGGEVINIFKKTHYFNRLSVRMNLLEVRGDRARVLPTPLCLHDVSMCIHEA